MKNYICINGNKIKLTEEQVKQLIFAKKPDPFKREEGKKYYVVAEDGSLINFVEDNGSHDIAFFEVGNYCTDEKLMRQRAYHETLNRLLWRFACENGELENEWNYTKSNMHYYIVFDENTKEFYSKYSIINHVDTVYFSSEETAEKAIGLIRQFMEDHPDFIW